MNQNLIILPVILPFIGALIGLLAPKSPNTQTRIGIATFAATFAASIAILLKVNTAGHLTLLLGGWEAPFGISFVVDRLAGLMVAVSCLVGLAVAIFSKDDLESSLRSNWFYPLSLFLVGAVNGSFITGDLFNLYVWFEIMLISSFALMTVGNTKSQFEGGFKYVAINLIASAFFLAGLGLLYGKMGTLNMADIALKLSVSPAGPLVNSSSALLLVAFSVKAGLFPFFFWLPASYHTPPSAITALFGGLLTKVGVYAIMRNYTLIFTQEADFIRGTILALSLATMLVGVFGATSHFDMKRILCFHIISQIGYMTLGLALFTQLAIASAIFYTAHHIIVKTNLLLIAGIVQKKFGTNDLSKTGSLLKKAPWLAILFLIPCLSLGGIPPLSGFWAKYSLVKEALSLEYYLTAGLALIVGVMTLYSMTKIWSEVFWKKAPEEEKITFNKTTWNSYLPVGMFCLLTVFIGLNPQILFTYAEAAADQLLRPNQYIEAVLSTEYIDTIRKASFAANTLNISENDLP
ncbi:Na+/H+ antiporter subunit D [Puniceicoccaceae bacterium K14]|nr:Na+/H+ antiporter subunit D [Puniceicoccaceae bacterium K14]